MGSHPLTKVRVIGSGLIGTSIALGLVQKGVMVQMVDADLNAQALATDLVGGVEIIEPELVIFALPTPLLPLVIGREFELNPNSTFMDVGSVKAEVLQHIEAISGLATKFLPTHPMAGRELGGASAARADLFQGRSWVLTPDAATDPAAKSLVLQLISMLGAVAIELSAADHDSAVARVSHLPQIVASLMAKQLIGAAPEWMELAGPGLRDTTRIAASDEGLWKEIIYANRSEISQLLIQLETDLKLMIQSLAEPAAIAALLAAGRTGRALIPGKHGGVAREYTYLPIVIDDKPGQLAAIFNECAVMNVNVEDLSIEHSPGQLSALITLALSEGDAGKLADHLSSIGWNVHPIRN